MKQVGKSVHSLDGKGLMEGRRAYTDDLVPSEALVLKVLRSPYAFAKILHIETSEARTLEGVVAVLTYEDFKRIPVTRAGQGYPEPSPHDKFVLDHYVRHVGDEVALVAARSLETAIKALSLIKVDYQVLEPVLDYEQAVDHVSVIHPEPEIHEMFPIGFEPKRNIAAAYHMEVGDLEATLKECALVKTTTYKTQAQAHTMMEPHTSFGYLDVHNRLTLVSSTQTPNHVRRIVAMALELPLSRVRVIKPRVGGGYGGKQCVHGEMLVAAMVLRTGQACHLQYTRKEVFESTYSRHPMRIRVTLGADQEGRLKALDLDLLSDTGAYGEHALTVFMVSGSKVMPLYNKVDAVRFGGKVVYTNHTPGGAFRGYGAIQGNYALESAIDEFCLEYGFDPITFREANMIREGESSPVFEKMGEGTEGTAMTLESCKLPYCIERGKELIGWKDKYLSHKKGEKVRGVGMAIAMQGSGIPYIDMASAIIKLNDDGFYNLIIGATDIGQGSDTVLAQIAAEALGTTVDQVVVYSSDTDLTPFDTGAYASSTTYVTGNAVKKAALNMRKLILEEGAKYFGTDDMDVHFDGVVLTDTKSGATISLRDLSFKLFYNVRQKQLVASDSYVGHKSPPPFMAGFAEVEVDTGTGQVTLLDYVAVVDCGQTINPALAKVQVEGGLVQGIGMALYEEVHVSGDGKLLTNNLMQYRIPSRKEIRNLQVEFAKSYESSGPYGAKSVGEIGIDTPPAAIANAIQNAIGVRIRSLPMTSEKIYEAIMTLKEEQGR